jgi:hypothetical protein
MTAGERSAMSRTPVIIGLIIAAVGFLVAMDHLAGFGQLPGDIFIQREGFTFCAPITLRHSG